MRLKYGTERSKVLKRLRFGKRKTCRVVLRTRQVFRTLKQTAPPKPWKSYSLGKALVSTNLLIKPWKYF
jgi:hypothetical protein